jgi:hypothetical protein
MRTRCVGYIKCAGDMRNAYKILPRKPEGERPYGISRHRWKDNITGEP